MSWLSLTKATTILDHDVERARESLGRAISKAWIVGPGGSPAPAIDPNVPLRIQVTPSPGWAPESPRAKARCRTFKVNSGFSHHAFRELRLDVRCGSLADIPHAHWARLLSGRKRTS
jgi:hypothetical protein